jgi:hypothetical protein
VDNEKLCDGVVECTALVLAESCAELDGRLTLFGILDELRPGGEGEDFHFVVYAKFEGCEHAAGGERRARILVTDEDGEVIEESSEYSARPPRRHGGPPLGRGRTRRGDPGADGHTA